MFFHTPKNSIKNKIHVVLACHLRAGGVMSCCCISPVQSSLHLEAMPGTKLVVPVMPRADCTSDRAPPVLKREATVQGGPNTANRLVVPVLLRADSVEIKKKIKKASAKQ